MFFFFNDTATTEIYTLSLHDALPIWFVRAEMLRVHLIHLRKIGHIRQVDRRLDDIGQRRDRKSTRLNSSHSQISYAVFCLKKNNTVKDLPHVCIDHLPIISHSSRHTT